jgi:hypothetical protein
MPNILVRNDLLDPRQSPNHQINENNPELELTIQALINTSLPQNEDNLSPQNQNVVLPTSPNHLHLPLREIIENIRTPTRVNN